MWVSGSICLCTINLWLECHFAANRTIAKYLSFATTTTTTMVSAVARVGVVVIFHLFSSCRRQECEFWPGVVGAMCNVEQWINAFEFWFIYIISQFVRLCDFPSLPPSRHNAFFRFSALQVFHTQAYGHAQARHTHRSVAPSDVQRGKFMATENKIDALFIWFYTSAKLKIFKIVFSGDKNRRRARNRYRLQFRIDRGQNSNSNAHRWTFLQSLVRIITP